MKNNFTSWFYMPMTIKTGWRERSKENPVNIRRGTRLAGKHSKARWLKSSDRLLLKWNPASTTWQTANPRQSHVKGKTIRCGWLDAFSINRKQMRMCANENNLNTSDHVLENRITSTCWATSVLAKENELHAIFRKPHTLLMS